MARTRPSDDTGRSPEQSTEAQAVFLLSSERSGSNLVRSILNTHTDVSAPHPLETAYPWQHIESPETMAPGKRRKLLRDILINKRFSYHPLTIPLNVDRVAERLERADRRSFPAVQEAIYAECTRVQDTSVWVSKYPDLWDCLDECRSYYDDLKVVYLVRDARDVVLSFKTSNIKFYHPYFSAGRWREEQEQGLALLDELGDRIHLVTYEDLLRNPERVIEEVCGFLGVDYQEEMLYYYETEDARAASRSSELLENLSVPIQSDNYGKFRDRLPDDEVRITEKIAGEALERFGYDLVTDPDELAAVELGSEEEYRREDRRMERRATVRHWREAPGEQVKRQLTTSFTAYMILRYGMLS